MENQSIQKRKFGLLTTIAMIVGIVVGSGIFFKSPQILKEVNGNMLMGIGVFGVAAVGIIFGGLTISIYAQKEDHIGGVITYCEMAWGKTMGYIAGWFQCVFYYPAICAVIAWVAANYTCALFEVPNLLVDGVHSWHVWVLAIIYLIGTYILNVLSTIKAGIFQNVAMFLKLGALIVLAVGGIIMGNPIEVIAQSGNYHTSSTGFLSALIVVIFAFDGWMVAPSIAHEIKNPKHNLPKALIIAPLIIAGIYLAYFIGISTLAGPDFILAGRDPLQLVATKLFGSMGMKIVMIFVIISVLGTLNGLVLGYIRLPYALATRQEIIFHKTLSKIHKKYDIPLYAALFTFVLCMFWMLLHFLSTYGTAHFNLTIFQGLEVDNLPIVLTYIFNGALYLAIIVKGMGKKTLSWRQRFLYPVLALLGAMLVIYGGMIQPKFNVYLLICFIGIVAGLLLRPKKAE